LTRGKRKSRAQSPKKQRRCIKTRIDAVWKMLKSSSAKPGFGAAEEGTRVSRNQQFGEILGLDARIARSGNH